MAFVWAKEGPGKFMSGSKKQELSGRRSYFYGNRRILYDTLNLWLNAEIKMAALVGRKRTWSSNIHFHIKGLCNGTTPDFNY